MIRRLVHATPLVLPHAPHERRERDFPPLPLMPSAEVAMKIRRARSLSHEHRQACVAATLVEKAVDEARLLFRAELLIPELVEVASFDDAARREIAACQRVADAEAEEVVLKTGCFADVDRLS